MNEFSRFFKFAATRNLNVKISSRPSTVTASSDATFSKTVLADGPALNCHVNCFPTGHTIINTV